MKNSCITRPASIIHIKGGATAIRFLERTLESKEVVIESVNNGMERKRPRERESESSVKVQMFDLRYQAYFEPKQ